MVIAATLDLEQLRCRVCGGAAARGWFDGWYCDDDACIEQRTLGRKLDMRQPRPPAAYCAPTRCYCGELDCPAIASYIIVNPAPELWRGELHAAAADERKSRHARELERRAAARAQHGLANPALDRIRSEWDTRGEDTWIDRL